MYLKDSKIIIIKIGSSLLIDDKKKVRKKWLTEFAKDIQELIKQNKKVIIVSSGAIAMGCKKLNISKKNLKIDKSQAVASIGQIELMNLFSETFIKQKINISQILLTLEDTDGKHIDKGMTCDCKYINYPQQKDFIESLIGKTAIVKYMKMKDSNGNYQAPRFPSLVKILEV